MTTNSVNWFEIAVADLGRAKNFYEKVFNKTLTEMPMGEDRMAIFPWVPGGTNAGGALVEGKNYTPSTSGTKIYFQCEDVNHEIALVAKHGGQIILPKMSIGESGNIALFMDTEGNMMGLHSMN